MSKLAYTYSKLYTLMLELTLIEFEAYLFISVSLEACIYTINFA